MYYVSFIHSSVSGHLGYFHILAVVNNAAVNIEVHVYFELVFCYSSLLFISVCMKYCFPPLFFQSVCAFRSEVSL